MKKIFKEIKGKKNTLIVIFFFVLLILIASAFYNFLVPSSGKPVYGNRLDGIENVTITEENYSALNAIIDKNTKVVSSNIILNGKTLNIVLCFNESTKAEDAKKIVTLFLDPFSKEQLVYYDIQILINNEGEEIAGFPIIAYKNRSADVFAYSQAE